MDPEDSLADDVDVCRLERARPHRTSQLLTAVLDPPWVVALVWMVASLAVPGITWPRRLSFLAVGLICLVGGPYSALLAFLRAGRLGDRQVVRRRERHRLYIAIVGWVVVGILAVVALGAPRRLVAVVVAMLIGLVLVAVANLFTKASFHTAVCAGAAVILSMLWWPAGLVLGVATPLVAWARRDEGRHSASQVILGAVLGVVGGSSFALVGASG
ncbi:hypothetical protein [Acidipropionibacterium acidipropionici]|uniref:hypothetical protein n=1 Tax=Acidipropionibacterium acidipropionici TaxID=1748 RepID=UPI00110B0117|nr:hypothetical protein [Acidipropionibacterium acidipropionici]QCV96226.1 hypothetical protein FEZ30_14025 [Acidipropionibacterium acidipropionici]